MLLLSFIAVHAQAQRKSRAPIASKPAPVVKEVKKETAPQVNEDVYTKTVRGAIGDKFDVSMTLQMGAGKLRGIYFYEVTDAFYIGAVDDRRIDLEGTIDDAGRFRLTERTNGKVTGNFRGRCEGTNADGTPVDEQALRLVGTWSQADNSNQMQFRLTEAGFDFRDGGRIVAQRRIEHDAAYRLSVARPLLKSSSQTARMDAFNRFVLRNLTSEITEFEDAVKEDEAASITRKDAPLKSLTIDYEVMIIDGDLISLRLSKNYFAGAYPSRSFAPVNFNLRTQREIPFKSLFKSEVDYEKALDRICTQLFKNTDYASFSRETRLSVTNTTFSGWNLTPEFLVLNFSVPHVLGDTVEVFIPYRELQEIINPTGAIAQIMP